MEEPRHYYFMLTFWGERFSEHFYSLCLPTLLSPNNLPVLRDRPGSKLIICTTEEDWNALKTRPLVIELAKYVEPFIIYIQQPGPNDFPQLHMSKGHRLAARKAHEDKAVAGFLAPDLLISDGLIKKAVDLIEAGKQAVLCPALRFGMESALEQLNARQCFQPDQPANLAPEFLSAVAVASLHSEILRYDFESSTFDDYPIWSYWRVPDRRGIVLYTVSWAMMLGDYAAVPNFVDQFLDESTIDGFFIHKNFGHLDRADKMIFLTDSYDGVFLSLTSETELTYFPLRHYKINQYPLLGTLSRLGHINRFYHSDVLDPLRRRCYTIPIVIHADAIDSAYLSVIVESKSLMRRATEASYAAIWTSVGIKIFAFRSGGRAYANLMLAHAGQYRRRVGWYLRIPFTILADVIAGRKTIRYAARRFLEETGLRRKMKK
jgi:hypothetical protein